MKSEYDVIVVGGGPAGSLAARTAAQQGLDVLLIEKRQEIGDPIRCAEGVGKVGLAEFMDPDPKWICADIKEARIYSPDGTCIELTEKMAGNEVGYVLERKIFDRAVAKTAARGGRRGPGQDTGDRPDHRERQYRRHQGQAAGQRLRGAGKSRSSGRRRRVEGRPMGWHQHHTEAQGRRDLRSVPDDRHRHSPDVVRLLPGQQIRTWRLRLGVPEGQA